MKLTYLSIILACCATITPAAAPIPIDAYSDISAYIDQQTANLPPPTGTRQDLVDLFGVPDSCLTGHPPQLLANDHVATSGGVEIRRWRLATCEGQIPLDALVGTPLTVDPVGVAIAIYGTSGSPARVFGLDEVDDYHHEFALKLAQAGYLVFVPTITTQDVTAENSNDLRNKLHRQLLSQGSTLPGVELGQMISAINFLDAQDAGSLIVWGVSLGGFLSAHLGALDERVDVTIVSQYFEDRRGKLLGEVEDYPSVYWQYENADYIIIPGYAVLFDDIQIASLIAPRSIIVEAGTQDPRWHYVQKIYPAIDALPGCSALVPVDGGHEIFFDETIAAVEEC